MVDARLEMIEEDEDVDEEDGDEATGVGGEEAEVPTGTSGVGVNVDDMAPAGRMKGVSQGDLWL